MVSKVNVKCFIAAIIIRCHPKKLKSSFIYF